MASPSAVMGKYGIIRNYEEKDLWEFYKANKQLLLNTVIFNNSKYPFRVVAVSGSAYIHLNVAKGGNVLDSAYSLLIESAKQEVTAAYGRGTANTNLDASKSIRSDASAFKKAMYSNIKELSKRIGSSYSADSLIKNIDNIKAQPNDMAAAQAIARYLLGQDLVQSNINPQYINYLANNKNIEIILRLLKKDKTGLISANLGTALEGLIVEIMEDIANQAKYHAAKALLYNFKKIGAKKESTQFISLENFVNKTNQVTTTKKINITPDIQVLYQSSPNKEAKKVNISLKLASDPSSIKYKTARGLSGEFWTDIARWNFVLKTFAAWAAKHPEFAPIQEYFGATVASLAIGGTKEDRALMQMTMTNGNIMLKSLDVVLSEIKSSGRVIMDQIKARNSSMYIENARIIASGRIGNNVSVLSGQAELEQELYGKYSKLKDLNLNFIIRTAGKQI